jgi:2-polyprenyl-3-methyl-5-hydroxy-6-metoxy-1,4-benzoquinol methylase
MTSLGKLLRWVAQRLEEVSYFIYRLANLINGLLPAVLSPSQLSKLVQEHYQARYRNVTDLPEEDFRPGSLEGWEEEVLDRYNIRKGRMLVMGTGFGREALGIARRGVSVVGIDTSIAALRVARRLSTSAGIEARYHLADFQHLPYRASSYDYAILACSMYSAIPGKAQRQMWLQSLSSVLSPGGLVILSFLIKRGPASRTTTICNYLNKLLVKLPGANTVYQPGDDCAGGHFLHTFLNEHEIREELTGAGVVIRELHGPRGFAVIAFLPSLEATA